MERERRGAIRNGQAVHAGHRCVVQRDAKRLGAGVRHAVQRAPAVDAEDRPLALARHAPLDAHDSRLLLLARQYPRSREHLPIHLQRRLHDAHSGAQPIQALLLSRSVHHSPRGRTMIRTRHYLAATLFLGALTAQAQTAPAKWADTISHEIDQAAISGDPAKLAAARALAERVATAFPDDGLILHYQAFALYREAMLMVGKGGDASAQLQRALTILEKSLKRRPLAEAHVLMSSIDGQLIARDPSRGMELGMASQASTTAAMSLAPTNPRVWLVRGQGAIFTPPEYGGGLKPAEEQLKRAIELFAKDAPKPGEPSWGKAEAHAWLGQVYAQMGDKAKAAEEYKAALAIAPDYAFAKSLVAALK